ISNTSFPRNAPIILNIKTYTDGTTLVHIARSDSPINAACLGPNLEHSSRLSLEQKLLIRVIQLNGTVTEINSPLNLDP
ncbi:3008_t:CDS:1, partial [Gigaspora rosea]